ncbi:MAG: NAD-dependent epimerase/dehydratase family protein [Candidatus Aureabacteria bacterium]|nr:NAD-dependent epimerase/dehydratase family protein [Candidatus Auribacterota bacterium]
MTQRVLVTGATGFTGGHLCLRLAERGYGVRVLVRSPEKAASLATRGVEVFQGDLKDSGSVMKASEGCATVYHIAATYRQEGVPDQEFRDVNVRGTQHALEAALRCGAERFVHCSTVGVHGHISHPPADETAPYGPGDLYQETKLEGEKLALEYFRVKGLPGVVFRPTGIYGPGDTRFLKLFRHIKSRRFHMIGSGGVYYHLTYIDDLVDGIILCGTKKEALGNIYILGGENYVTLNEMVRTIAEILGVGISRVKIPFWPVYAAAFVCEKLCKPIGIEPPLYRRRVDFFRKDRAFDISKARRELGFDPKVGVREGLKRTADWYSEQGLL